MSFSMFKCINKGARNLRNGIDLGSIYGLAPLL